MCLKWYAESDVVIVNNVKKRKNIKFCNLSIIHPLYVFKRTLQYSEIHVITHLGYDNNFLNHYMGYEVSNMRAE